MATARGIDDLLPTAALAVAVAALEEDQRLDDLDGNTPRVKRTRRLGRKRDIGTCAWAQLLEDRDLLDPASITVKQFRTDFRVLHPFFLELVKVVKRKEWFPTAKQDPCGRQCHPVEHKVSTAGKHPT